MDSTVSNIIFALGGLGLFLYGMKLLGDGLELAAGAKLRKILEKITSNRWLGALVGVIVTAIIQSSTAVSVMVVGFVNASLMTLSQAMGVIMGATIGTTVTSLILSFNIAQYMPIFICIGAKQNSDGRIVALRTHYLIVHFYIHIHLSYILMTQFGGL